jgi:hypothetical protein
MLLWQVIYERASMTIRRPSETRWEWQDGVWWRAVQIFPATRKLIWSSWVERPEGLTFDDGFAQSFEQFLEGAPAPVTTPPQVLDELRAAIAPKKRGLFGFFKR